MNNKHFSPNSKSEYMPFYGNLTEINTKRTLLDLVGMDVLTDIATSYLDLLQTSSAVYETNGDYALGIFSSGWCRALDAASRKLCKTDDNQEALRSGKWLCHESCWTECSKVSIEEDRPVDIECNGGIHLYAVPIKAGGEIVGSINFGYGSPPKDPEKLREIAGKYHIDINELSRLSDSYEDHSEKIINAAKKRLITIAKIIGILVEKSKLEKEMKDRLNELEIFYTAAVGREEKIVELKEEIYKLKTEMGKQ